MADILVVDDELRVTDVICLALKAGGHRPTGTTTAGSAVELARRTKPDLAIIDLRLGGAVDGLALFKALKARQPDLIGIMLTAFGTFHSALECGEAGFAEYLAKPFDADELINGVDRALALRRPAPPSTEAVVPTERPSFDGMIGASPPMLALFERIVRIAPLNEPVLILGETGTGKELVARSIHKRSRRCIGPFVDVNCAAIPATLFEAEFFGHERGAFTDAKEAKPGKFEQAHRGTLFLDEIGDLPTDIQAKLLRIMEHGEVTRLGGRRAIPIDVRIVAATNADLASHVERGKFRRDLYWRLHGISLALPPLRERGEDLRLLVEYVLPRLARDLGTLIKTLTEDAFRELGARHWAGNVRELQHVLREALLSARGPTVEVQDLRVTAQGPSGRGGDRFELPEGLTLEEGRSQIERQMIEQALSRHDSAGAAAKALGIDPKTLYERRRRYGL
jgi:DNA-binding NtrC family response regulator